MASYTITGARIIEAQVYEPRVGAWTADVEADSDADITGSVTMQLGDVSMVGTVYRGGVESGRWVGRVVGGAGGLRGAIQPKNYAGPGLYMSAVIADILTESGETLDTASADYSDHELANWHRTRGPAGHALQAVCDELSVPWRVTRSGTVLVGTQTPSELDTEQVEIVERPDVGAMIVAPDADPELRPGVLFDGREVSYVATIIEAGKLRQELWFDDTTGAQLGRVKGSLLRLIDAAVGRKLLYCRMWPCTVATQAGDGALEVVPDDTEVKGAGLGRIYIRHGQPGYETEVPAGARCMVGFEAGDPKRPYVAQWLAGTDVTEIVFDGGAEDIARTNDDTDPGTLAYQGYGPSPGPQRLQITYTPGGGGVPTVVTLASGSWPGGDEGPYTISLAGIITSGNPKLKA